MQYKTPLTPLKGGERTLGLASTWNAYSTVFNQGFKLFPTATTMSKPENKRNSETKL